MALHSASKQFYSINTIVALAFLLVFCFWPYTHLELLRSSPLQSELSSRSVSSLESSLLTPLSANSSILIHRDDYSCSAARPCANGACCGPSGYCGYGPTYCGSGCVSNCNAVAECGQYATPAGKTCPLNTCCSQYGFCGTTQDFCTTSCQSNCVLNPKPPTSSTSNILQKVIGYYESWSARLPCHTVAPSDLPLDALTHLNYAFAYIDPTTFQIVTMDPQTPAQLFQDVANVKSLKSTIKVWVSVGGWTFSDNGTATQAVFGNIAASAANRQKFANNVVKFMNFYGFDGIDIDWEYPGAPDRGGQPQDTENFVLLLQTLRSTFDQNPRGLGISFTAPSSYWYLRWFDLPGMLRYADWINLMTYDLHGTWDRNNPIGSIVQGHTNLTEIALATELLWRVNVPPSKVVMGFGFYGRSFQLSNPSCTTPGCQFTGGASPGPCSATSGILMYYEIMALLNQHPELQPVWDKTAAVKYVTYNGNQWVSYDDADTLKQKVAWANSQGIGGALIWASDTDDDKYTAHTGLIGTTIGHADTVSSSKLTIFPNPGAIAQNVIGDNGQDCKILQSCTDQENIQARSCGSGWTRIGYEKGNCGGSYGNSICCPSGTSPSPSSCIWRGSGGDCNGQCHPGEATLFGSSWGGYPTESNMNRCSRGYKVFCCGASDWKEVVGGCRWTGCGGSCNSNEDPVSQKYDSSWCTVANPIYTYCCPKPALLYDCRWVGSNPDCADAKCNPDEVTLDLNPQGSGYGSCSWGRKKADCCKIKAPPPLSLTCRPSLCEFEQSLCDVAGDNAFGAAKRELSESHLNVLEARGPARRFPFKLLGVVDSLSMLSRPYPSRGTLFTTRLGLLNVLRRFLRMRNEVCEDGTVASDPVNVNNLDTLPPNGQTEHPIDLSMHSRFIQSANTGILPSGLPTRAAAIPSSFFEHIYITDSITPNSLPPVTSNSPDFTQPANRVFEAFGSNTNRGNLILTEAQINLAKGSLFILRPVIAQNDFAGLVQNAIRGDDTSTAEMLQTIRVTIGAFRYLQNIDVNARVQATRELIGSQFQILESTLPGSTGLFQHWEEFYNDYLGRVENFAQTWVLLRINEIRQMYSQAREAGTPGQNEPSILLTLLSLERQIGDMTLPRE